MPIDRNGESVGVGLVTSAILGTVEVRILFDEDEIVDDFEIILFAGSEVEYSETSMTSYLIGADVEDIIQEDPSVISDDIMSAALLSEAIAAACFDFRKGRSHEGE